MISKSNSTNSLSSLSSSLSNKAQTAPKEQITTSEDDSDLTEVSSLFQKPSLLNARSILITKSLASYIDDIASRIFYTKRKIEPEAIKEELIQIIDLEKAKEVDFGELTFKEFGDICREQSKILLKTYRKIHGFKLTTEQKIYLIKELRDYLYWNLVTVANVSNKFEVGQARSLFNDPHGNDECGDIYG